VVAVSLVAVSAVGGKMDVTIGGVTLNGFKAELNGKDLKPRTGPKLELAAVVIKV
jgi:hypothetical protein